MKTKLIACCACAFFACDGASDDATGAGGSPTSSTVTITASSASGSEATSGTGGQAPVAAPDPTAFRATASMAVKRNHHTATVLQDGRVLVVGGETGSHQMLDAVEIFDPSTETWQTLTPLPEPRSNHTATLLRDGRVLVTGGGTSSTINVPNGEIAFDTALVFDPGTATFTPTGSMSDKRADHRAAMLADGRILVVGGATDQISEPCTEGTNCTVAAALATADVYDPANGTFTPVGSMSETRYSTVTATLKDGRVVVAGGVDGKTSLATAEIFDPASSSFSALPSLKYERLFGTGAVTGSGKMIVAGGKKADIAPHAQTEVFDPTTSTWSVAGQLSKRRTGAQALTLQSGHVIHVGGYDQLAGTDLPNVEIFDEATASWTRIGDLTKARSVAASVVLTDGRVLVTGGSAGLVVLSTCEIGAP